MDGFSLKPTSVPVSISPPDSDLEQTQSLVEEQTFFMFETHGVVTLAAKAMSQDRVG